MEVASSAIARMMISTQTHVPPTGTPFIAPLA